MNRRFYIKNRGACWSLSKEGYTKLLRDGAEDKTFDIDLPKYEARLIKKAPSTAKPIGIADFESEHYQEELEHFLKTGEQTGFNAANFVSIFFED